jgi:hypothetical protein
MTFIQVRRKNRKGERPREEEEEEERAGMGGQGGRKVGGWMEGGVLETHDHACVHLCHKYIWEMCERGGGSLGFGVHGLPS